MKRRTPFAIATANARDLENRLYNIKGFDMAMATPEQRDRLETEVKALKEQIELLLDNLEYYKNPW